MKTSAFALSAAFAIGTSAAHAALVSSQIDPAPTSSSVVVDGVINAGEYSASYTGGGSGFGGTLGNGTIFMDRDASNLYIGFQPGGSVNDLVAILLDTKAGGFTDAQMDDNGDGARRAVSQQSINADDAYDPSFLADYGLVFAGFGSVLFETTTGAPLNFLSFDGTGTFPRELAIPLSTLSLGASDSVKFFAAYIADSGFGSNESIPAYAPLNTGGNPGFDNTSAGYGNYNEFAVPEPASFGLLGLAGLSLLGRRRAR